MEQEFHIPTEVLNDANAAALGEAWIGAAKGKKDVVVVTIGTGVGGGILMNGKILLGASGFAGELGHIPVQYEGEMCTCGNRGCLEHYGSTSALVRKVRWAIQKVRLQGQQIHQLMGDGFLHRQRQEMWWYRKSCRNG